MTDREREDLELAARAFGFFTMIQKKAALDEFAQLRYPSSVDRFHEAVYRVIVAGKTKESATS